MTPKCNLRNFEFQGLGRRSVVGRFDGGKITSDAGGLLLREVERRTRMMRHFAKCFRDERKENWVEHSVEELVRQRVYGLALGYEDLNDHDELREDFLLATLVEKEDPTGESRVQERDRGKPLAGKSTLNRLELYSEGKPKDRYKKIAVDGEGVGRFWVKMFLESRRRAPKQIVLDVDATDDPLHGQQEGRFFHGYYKCYCYFPLYIFCEGFPLHAELRPSNMDASKGTVEAVKRIVEQIRKSWPRVKILIRGDSGFAREEIMAWCEANEVGYVLGLARNARLAREIEEQLQQVKQEYEETQIPSRTFAEFQYRTLKTWTRSRRVVAKAEHLAKGSNPRFVVTSLSAQQGEARRLYEAIYCARGDMENRIKEQQLALFADRTSSTKMQANQLRLWFSTLAYLLIHQLRRLGLKGTALSQAQCDTIRLKLLKIGAQVKITVRRIVLSLASGYPYERIFAQAYDNLSRAGPVSG